MEAKMLSLKLKVVFFGLLAMAEQSIQLSVKNPLRMPGYEANPNYSVGLIVTSIAAEKALNNSGLFLPSHQSVNIYGRTFINGTIHGLNIVYARSASVPSVNVGMTVQLLCENFDVNGIIYYGTAGSTNEELNIGDVVVPNSYKFTGAWEWLSKDSEIKGDMNIGDYNYPDKGINLLGSLLYATQVDVYSNGKLLESPNLPITPLWILLARAASIQVNGGKIVYELDAASSDIYVSNPTYSDFLHNKLQCGTVDTTGAAFSLGSLSCSLGYIVFQGISNQAGVGSSEDNTALACENAFSAAAQFIQFIVDRLPPVLV